MLTLIGTIIGLFGSLFPQLLKYFQSKIDNAHEVEMFKLSVDAAKMQAQFKMAEIEAQADISESQALYKASEIKTTGNPFFDGLISLYQSSVRPTLTYLFFALYAMAKVGQYVTMMNQTGGTLLEVVWKLYNSDDMALFATIISYWFGARSMKAMMDRMGGGNSEPSLTTGTHKFDFNPTRNGNGNGTTTPPTTPTVPEAVNAVQEALKAAQK